MLVHQLASLWPVLAVLFAAVEYDGGWGSLRDSVQSSIDEYYVVHGHSLTLP